MKQPSKQQLRDRIAELEKQREWDLGSIIALEKVAKVVRECAAESEAKAKQATIAAYALLATLFVIVVMEIVL